jgi:hypothetical protein
MAALRLSFLETGEQAHADKILLDETEARREAVKRRLNVVGTPGILREGSRKRLLELPAALAAPQRTSFYVSPELILSRWGWMVDRSAGRGGWAMEGCFTERTQDSGVYFVSVVKRLASGCVWPAYLLPAFL